MQKKTWIAVGAASALGLGVIAGGAVATANEMGLTSDDTSVPGLTSPGSSGSTPAADVTFDITSDSIVSPSPASTESPVSPLSPASVSAASPLSPASVSAASPISPASVDSPASPASPASIASPMSPASVASAESAASAGSAD